VPKKTFLYLPIKGDCASDNVARQVGNYECFPTKKITDLLTDHNQHSRSTLVKREVQDNNNDAPSNQIRIVKFYTVVVPWRSEIAYIRENKNALHFSSSSKPTFVAIHTFQHKCHVPVYVFARIHRTSKALALV